MKKILLSSGLILFIGLAGALANEGPAAINKKVIESFNDRFAGAVNVSWTEESDLEIATFRFEGLAFFAYFDKQGEWVATARNILSNQLPIPLLLHLKRDYHDFWISALVEVDSQSGISYFVTLENASKTLLLNSTDYADWTVSRKDKKE
jgi:hypothetical protein